MISFILSQSIFIPIHLLLIHLFIFPHLFISIHVLTHVSVSPTLYSHNLLLADDLSFYLS